MIVSEKQSLIDVTVQETGSVEAIIKLAKKNGLPITSTLAPGQTIEIDSTWQKKQTVAYLNGRRVNTGLVLTATDESETKSFDDTFDDTFE